MPLRVNAAAPHRIMSLTLDHLRRFAVSRSLFPPTTLPRALEAIGFVQADPIRAPARAQDLTLRHRVSEYKAGDLERRYTRLPVEEDFFINYGFVTRSVQALMHPRAAPRGWPAGRRAPSREAQLLAFVRERGSVHPRVVDAHFSHGNVTNYWGGSSRATTHMLDGLHYRGLLRIARRENGIRVYAPRDPGLPPQGAAGRNARIDALVDVVVRIYAPLPSRSLSTLVGRLRYAAPQWRNQLRSALQRARHRLAHARVDGVDWFWPTGERPAIAETGRTVRLLSPFDPVAWDRHRFELLWGWPYRFEAYTPAPKRRFGYYALPLLWADRVVGWANVAVRRGALHCHPGYVDGQPREPAFARAFDAELERMRRFLAVTESADAEPCDGPRSERL